METLATVMAELDALGSASAARVLAKHGGAEAAPSVKVGDLKTILKRTKQDHALALQLWDTGDADAQYLAGLMCVPKRISEAELDGWARTASWRMVAEYSVPWVAAEAGLGWACGRRWIDAEAPLVVIAGWAALAGHVTATEDDALDLPGVEALLDRVLREAPSARDEVRRAMNGWMIAVGVYVAPLRARAEAVARSLGPLEIDVGDTACKIPFAPEYVAKVLARGPAKKRKKLRC